MAIKFIGDLSNSYPLVNYRNYGKSPCYSWVNPLIVSMAIFNSCLYVYQRVCNGVINHLLPDDAPALLPNRRMMTTATAMMMVAMTTMTMMMMTATA